MNIVLLVYVTLVYVRLISLYVFPYVIQFYLIQNGEICFNDTQCITLSCNRGVCLPKKTINEACDSNFDCNGFTCSYTRNTSSEASVTFNYGTCGGNGALCTVDSGCSSNFCSSGMCVRPLTSLSNVIFLSLLYIRFVILI